MRKMIAWIVAVVLQLIILIELISPVLNIAISYYTYGIVDFSIKFTYFSLDGLLPVILLLVIDVLTIYWLDKVKFTYRVVCVWLIVIAVFLGSFLVFDKPYIIFNSLTVIITSLVSFVVFIISLFNAVLVILEESLPRKEFVVVTYSKLQQHYGVDFTPVKQEIFAMIGRRDFKMIEATAKVISSETE